MDAERFDGLVKALGAGTHRRRVLGGLLGALATSLGPGRVGARQVRLCCSAVCLDGALCAAGNVVHDYVKLKGAPTQDACPLPPPGYEATGCREVVPNCSDCGKTVCPARD
jgi:hypothetical protein